MGRQKLPPKIPNLAPPIPLLFVFHVRGQAKERQRTRRFKSGAIGHYTPQSTVDFENLINAQAMAQHNITEPFTADLAITIYFRVKHRRHGDIDNMVKSVLDGMQPVYKDGIMKRPGIFRNDKCIKKLSTEMFYELEAEPCIEVILHRHTSQPWIARLARNVILLAEKVSRWLGQSDSCKPTVDPHSQESGQRKSL